MPQRSKEITSDKPLTLSRPEEACSDMEDESSSCSRSDVESSGSSWRRLSGIDDSTSQKSDKRQNIESTMGARKSIMQQERESKKRGRYEKNCGKKKVKVEENLVLNNDKKSVDKAKFTSSPGSQQAVKTRRTIPCPMPWCSSKVIHLPRHMRTVHKWSKEAASKVLLKYNIRKRKNPGASENSKEDKEATKSAAKKKITTVVVFVQSINVIQLFFVCPLI